MKKYILVLILLLFSIVAFSEEWTLKNLYMSVGLNQQGKNISFAKIKDLKTNTDFIEECDKNNSLWFFIVKNNKDYADAEIKLYPSDAEKVSVKNTDTNMEIIWKNVKKSFMDKGFDVIVTVELKDNNSYWHIKIDANSKDYGIWTVTFPYVSNIDAKNNDELMYPYSHGWVFNKFDDPRGFKKPYSHNEDDPKSYSKDIGFIMPVYLQLSSLTKGKSSLYLCGEDLKGSMKSTNYILPEPNKLDYVVRNFPDNMGEAGFSYNQGYKFNIGVVEGDWYNCAKKYRKWGIENKYGVFANGKIEDREDLPDWYKYNPIWLRWTATIENGLEYVIKMQNYLNVPCGVHIYNWSQYQFDTYYPNWLPAKDTIGEGIKKLHENNMYVMPYTNALIIDINQSPYYKKYGDILTSKDEKGIPVDTPYKNNGADNRVACPNSPYFEAYLEEIRNIAKEYDIDALYMDQIGATCPYTCFDTRHNHPVGGGDRWTLAYRNLLNDVRDTLNKTTGKKVVVTTEDSCDAYGYDGWLRCNDVMAGNEDTPVNTVIYSGYGISFGDRYYPKEFESENSISAINKVAVDLTKGIQPGWQLCRIGNEFEMYPKFAEYFKNMTMARVEAIKYFNFGEMVRPVKITSEIPRKVLYWEHYSGVENREYPMVRTGSFNYNGKTCVVFTNISQDKIEVEWESKWDDLNLKNQILTISQLYPKENKIIENNGPEGTVKSSFIIEPLETIVYVVK